MTAPAPLLAPDDPPPATTLPAARDTALVLVCDHAGRAVPAALGDLGVPRAEWDRHIAWDIGAMDVARRLAARFGCARWQAGVTGAPLLDEALVSFDCRVSLHRQIGTHHVLFGEVEAVRFSGEGRPLIYARRGYAVPSDLLG